MATSSLKWKFISAAVAAAVFASSLGVNAIVAGAENTATGNEAPVAFELDSDGAYEMTPDLVYDFPSGETTRLTYDEAAGTAEELADRGSLEELFIQKLFYGDIAVPYKDYGKEALTGKTLDVYNFLRERIEAVAATEETRTVFTYTATGYSGFEPLKADLKTALNYLLADMPESFYWFDKTVGYKAKLTSDGVNYTAVIAYAVSEDYAAKSSEIFEGVKVTVSTEKMKNADIAVATATRIANRYKNEPDYDKIVGYRNEICGLVSYDRNAADNPDTPYGNPWQLVYVFDGDSSTNVVCEGYAKAFQYLCDLGGIECYTVTGTMAGGTGAGAHMWNIVVLNGVSYLVDITNCDDGTIGNPYELLLKGASESDEKGCTFANLNGLNYAYDSKTRDIYSGAGILAVSTEDYDPDGEHRHVYDENVWVGNDTGHWHKCEGCDEKIDLTYHIPARQSTLLWGEFDGSYACMRYRPHYSETECIDCGYVGVSYSTGTLPEHRYDLGQRDYDDKTHWHNCNFCEEHVNEVPHLADNGKVTLAPTADTEGVRTYSCTSCSYVIKEETIPPLGENHEHDYTIWGFDNDYSPPYSTTFHYKECICGERDPESIGIHWKGVNIEFDQWETIEYNLETREEIIEEATYTNPGIKYIYEYCPECDRDTGLRSEYIPHIAHDHVPGDECYSYGDNSENHFKICTLCGRPIKEPHVPSEPVRENITEPTCSEEGSCEEIVYCEVCEDYRVLKEDYEGDGRYEISRTVKTLDKLPHAYGDWTITTEPTFRTKGEAERVCVNDDTHVDTVTLPVLSDKSVWTLSEREAPTAEKEGYEKYTSEYGTVTVILEMLPPGHPSEPGPSEPGGSETDPLPIQPPVGGEFESPSESDNSGNSDGVTSEETSAPVSEGAPEETSDNASQGDPENTSETVPVLEFEPDPSETAAGDLPVSEPAAESNTSVPPINNGAGTNTETSTGTNTGITAGVSVKAEIKTSIGDLKTSVLTETELELTENGASAEVVLSVSGADNTAPEADKQAVISALSHYDGYKLGQYINISLSKVINGAETQVTNTDIAVSIVITVPDWLSRRGREFAVIRVHEGEAEMLSDTDSNPDTITIETDRFSTYAIVYKDTDADKGENPDTGIGSDNAAWVGIIGAELLMSVMVFLGMVKVGKRKDSKRA